MHSKLQKRNSAIQGKGIRVRRNPFENLNNEKLKLRFRFDKKTVMEIVHLIDLYIKPMTLRNKSISPFDQLLIVLRFYVTGAFQKVIGDTVNISQSIVNKIMHKVTRHSFDQTKFH